MTWGLNCVILVKLCREQHKDFTMRKARNSKKIRIGDDQILQKVFKMRYAVSALMIATLLGLSFGRVNVVYAATETVKPVEKVRHDIHLPKRATEKVAFLIPQALRSTQISVCAREDSEEQAMIWMDWTRFESGDASWWQTGGDGGNAFGRYQFDKRCALGSFLMYCAEKSAEYAGLAPYANADGTASDDGTLAEAWKWICQTKAEEFFALQTDFALNEYYYPVKADLFDLYQIELDQYGPVLKGTVWSIAIRDGKTVSLSPKRNRLRSVTETYSPGIDEREWLAKIYACEAQRHTTDPERWSEGQFEAAMQAYDAWLQGENAQIDGIGKMEMLLEDAKTIIMVGN